MNEQDTKISLSLLPPPETSMILLFLKNFKKKQAQITLYVNLSQVSRTITNELRLNIYKIVPMYIKHVTDRAGSC